MLLTLYSPILLLPSSLPFSLSNLSAVCCYNRQWKIVCSLLSASPLELVAFSFRKKLKKANGRPLAMRALSGCLLIGGWLSLAHAQAVLEPVQATDFDVSSLCSLAL